MNGHLCLSIEFVHKCPRHSRASRTILAFCSDYDLGLGWSSGESFEKEEYFETLPESAETSRT